MKEVDWNAPIYEEFLRLTYLTDFQRKVMDKHVIERKTNYQIAMELTASESSVQRAIKECKKMYDSVKPYSDILPERKCLRNPVIDEGEQN